MGVKGTVSATFSLLLSLFLFNALCPQLIRADGTVGMICYGFNGLAYVNNTQCPGSNACCGYQATCLSNRLCHNPGDPAGTYVRGPCANNEWDSTCAQVCMFNETEVLAGYLPRVSQCDDGSWCCNNDATCCSNGRGVFLDSEGYSATAEATATTSYPPVSGTGLERSTVLPSTTTTSSTSVTPTSSISTTVSSATPQATSAASSASTATGTAAASESSSDDDDDDSGTKIGLGVGVGLGIPLAAIVAGGSVWFFLRRKRQPNNTHLAGSDEGLQNGSHYQSSDGRIPSGSHFAGSDYRVPNASPFVGSDGGYTDGGDASSAMLTTARSSKIELSGEGRQMHELQSMSLSPGYQHPQYPNPGPPDSRQPTHSYELP